MVYNRIRLQGLTAALAAAAAYAALAANAQTAEQSRKTEEQNAAILRHDEERVAAPIEPMIGRYEKYTVQKGDTLFKIARGHNTSMSALIHANGLKQTRLRPGQKLLLPTLSIVPRNPGDGVVLNVPERALYVVRGGEVEARYPVAVGKADWQTALGEFKVRKKLVNPPWTPPKSMVEREDIPDEIVPPGPDNPLGDRWIGWTAPGFGFHGTIAPQSIGRAASHGCVRLYPEAAHSLFDQVKVGMPIYSVYEPVTLGERDGRIYLSVFPDIYKTGETRLAHVEKILAAAGLLPVVDPISVKTIVAKADGYPHRILGSDEPVAVNGTPIQAGIAPTRLHGQWIVPLRATADALGAQIQTGGDTVKVTANGHELSMTNSQSAILDGKEITLAVPPTVVKDTMLVPLAALTELTGARTAYEKSRGLEVTTGAVAAAPASPATPSVRFHRRRNSVPGRHTRQ